MLTELIQAAEIRDIVVSERMKVYEASFKFDIGKAPAYGYFSNIIRSISERDKIKITLQDESERICDFTKTDEDSYGMKFTDAVKLLCEESPSFIPTQSAKKEKPPFKLPERYCNCRRIRAYLNHRGISDEVITYCISHEILYESVPYHNAVFVGKDESGKARYAFLRGIYEKNGKGFKMEQTGSEKKYSFCIPPERETKRVVVYEACIDALAHMTLEEGKRDKYRLSLGGIAAPKENT